ncbi:MAG: hypothetical protein PHY93_05185 [Bacteriovorax sp.]|nr:hypothetical protein [Bacteriovorax sp.]
MHNEQLWLIGELRIDGNLAKQIKQLDQKLVSHNRVVVDIKSSITESAITNIL